WIAGYLQTGRLAILLRRRQRNIVLRSMAKYVMLSLGRTEDAEGRQALLDNCRRELGLTFLDAWFETRETLIASCGEKVDQRDAEDGLDTVERVRINTSYGHCIIVHYQFAKKPEELELRDVTASIVQVFEHAALFPPKATVLPIDSGRRKAKNGSGTGHPKP
ncbi:MAG: hypothetical protein GY851_22570, partial [bacterium]|nr:hypothetical protein [bacterium]